MAALLSVVAVLYAPAWAHAQDQSAYQRLDPDTLARKLANLGMNELLTELTSQSGSDAGSLAQLRLLAATKMAAYRNKPQAPNAAQLLQEAEQAYTQAVTKFREQPPANDTRPGAEAWMNHCEDLKQLAYVVFLQAEAHGVKVLYLHAVDSDYQMLQQRANLGNQIVSMLDGTLTQLNNVWSTKPVMVVLYSQKLEEMKDRAALRGGWIRFYLALSLKNNPDQNIQSERISLLRQAIESFQRFIPTNRRFPQAKWPAHLVTGMASREMNDFERARNNLQAVQDDQAPSIFRFQGAFELAKVDIDQALYLVSRAEQLEDSNAKAQAAEARRQATGIFERSPQKIEAFVEVGDEAFGKNHHFTDMYSALLTSHLYQSWAGTIQNDDAKVAELQAKAQKPLIAFFETHKDNQEVLLHFSSILAAKFAGRDDVENLNAMILYAMALQARARKTDSGNDQARKLLEIISQRDTPAAENLKPNVRFMLAELEYAKLNAIPAAKLFEQVARDYPENDLAFQAALNAVIILNQLAEDRSRETGGKVPAQLRAELISALELLLIEGPDPWAEKEGVEKYWFELGWNREKLARFRSQAEGLELLSKAIDAYQKVPADQPNYLQARNQQLWIRVTRLRFASDEQQAAQAGPLAQDLLRFVEELTAELPNVQEDDRKQLMRTWAAMASFHAYRIQYNMLDRKDVLVKVQQLPEKWPDTGVMPLAAGFYIEKLIEQQRIDEALAQLEKHQSSLDVEDARPLFVRVLRETQKRLDDLANDPQYQEEIDRYRKVYYRASDWLYRQAMQNNAEGLDLYTAEQAYAFALQQGGKYEEALELYNKLLDQEEKKRQEEVDKIKDRLNPLLEEAKEAGNTQDVENIYQRFVKVLEEDEIEAVRLRPMQPLEFSMQRLDEAQTQQQVRAAVEEASRRLAEAIQYYRKYQIDRVAVDPYNVLGVARSKAGLGELDEAMEGYVLLTRGLSPEVNEELFWQVWKEYSLLLIEKKGSDATEMKKLLRNLELLLKRDPDFGGYQSEFLRILQRVRQLASR
ncbi:MAG: hypothetical protein ACLFUJ_08370 [Phycisphaerae bacterium]